MSTTGSDEFRHAQGDQVSPRTLFSLRSFYFFQYGALGIFFPFLPLLLESRELSPSQISLVMVLIPACNLIVPPCWGAFADSLRARLPFLRIACIGSGFALLLLLPDLRFWGNLFVIGAISFFRAPITSLGDAATYDALGGARAEFSTVRVFGSIGFALFVLVPGFVAGPHQVPFVILATAAIYWLAGASTVLLRSPTLRREKGVLGQTIHVLKEPAIVLFLVASAVYYTGHAAYDSCFSLYLRELGSSDAFIGTAWSIGVIAEILLMLAAPRFIHRLPAGVLLTISAFVAALRWVILSWVRRFELLLAAQTLHAVTFGLWYLCLVKVAQEKAPDHLRTSLQSITLAAVGMGMVIGYLAGGQLLEHSSGRALFLTSAISAIVAAFLYAFSYQLQRSAQRKKPLVDALSGDHS